MNTYLSIFGGYKIVKSNKIIQAKSSFSFLEHRIILLAMARIQPKDTRLKMYRINIRDVLGTAHTSNYHIVRSALERLHKSVITIEEGKKWKSYSFITKAEGEYGKSYISIQFHEDIQNFLLGLRSQYTSYVLKNVIKFRRNYSLRIYELCKQYEKMGSREFDLSYLRKIFSLEKKYKSINLFKVKVIENSIEEINNFSDLFLNYQEIKCGRKIEKIKFFIKKNEFIENSNLVSKRVD